MASTKLNPVAQFTLALSSLDSEPDATGSLAESIHREFHEENRPSPGELIDPSLKARRLARYLEHLATIYERGTEEQTHEGLQRAALAAFEIQRHILGQGLPHELLTKLVSAYAQECPQLSAKNAAAMVLMGMMHGHPFVGFRLQPDRIEVAVEAWRVDGRKNRAVRRAEGVSEKRWEALAAVLEGTGAQVAPSTIKQAFFARRTTAKKRPM
jgi:hypothetical protein